MFHPARPMGALLLALASLAGGGGRATPIAAAPSAPISASLAYPETNGADSHWAADDHTLVYTVDDPAHWPTLCVSCGDAPFTAFRVRFYIATIHGTGARVSLTKPRLFYTGPTGIHFSVVGVGEGWVVYIRSDSAHPPELSGQWSLVAQNIASGHDVVLDSAELEGLPSIGVSARVVGKEVVWSTWTAGPNGGTSIMRSYDLSAGTKRVVAHGGSPSTWSYTWPDISGHQVIFEKATPTYHQILLKDLVTGSRRALTPASGWSSEPTLSGNIAAWKDGAQYDLGKGVMIANLKTGRVTEMRPGAGRYDAENPVAFGGSYVVIDASHIKDDLLQTLYLYDAHGGTQHTLFDSKARTSWVTGNDVMKGGSHTFLYYQGKMTTPGDWTARLVLLRSP
jgi:hypothetical protein